MNVTTTAADVPRWTTSLHGARPSRMVATAAQWFERKRRGRVRIRLMVALLLGGAALGSNEAWAKDPPAALVGEVEEAVRLASSEYSEKRLLGLSTFEKAIMAWDIGGYGAFPPTLEEQVSRTITVVAVAQLSRDVRVRYDDICAEQALRASGMMTRGTGRSMEAHVPAIARLLASHDASIRWAAIATLGFIGPAAGEGVAALAGVMEEGSRFSASAAVSLGRIGEASLPRLRAAIRESDPDRRKIALAGWGEVPSVDAPDFVLVAALLRDPVVRVRVEAAQTVRALVGHVRDLAAQEKTIAALLAPFLHDPSPHVRDEIHTAFGALRREGCAQLDKIRAAADQAESAGVRGSALETVRRIASVEVALPVLLKGLADPNESVRLKAAIQLGLLGGAALPALPELRARAQAEESAGNAYSAHVMRGWADAIQRKAAGH